ncbi:phosphatase [Tenacibaculum holothuriorum]|uniref:Phosphatase n=1 Tax=Tenacibaculum holothuriorum TaxID=1635173 RepID=A0A1Y2PEV2_9FLAO|nr:alkaline phosphatase PhoX [Tenacibaculum holothuriorum]OSY88198.1 phosphatase [Tenacibaculum holothuriorum]
MKHFFKASILATCTSITFLACKSDTEPVKGEDIELKAHSKTPNFLKLNSAFSNVKVYPILSSEDRLVNTPNFIYGSMADGAGLIRNTDGSFNLINNIEADYSIARIKFDKTFKPVEGEYILNANATAKTAQCSGSLITPEEHGFGPLYLSGGEWGGSSKGVFVTDPTKSASAAGAAQMLTALGQWSTENAVAIGKDAYPNKTVVFIGDDHSDNSVPSGQLGMYVGNRGDLNSGKLYGLKVTDAGITYEVDMKEGQTYNASFVELTEKNIDLLDAEAKQKGVMGFSRLEDIDWRRGSAKNNREIYFCVTGRKKDGLKGKGTIYGRIYKVVLNDNDPTGAAKITCVLDGDLTSGKAKAFHSPDNILVTENYAYIQEDPNGYFDGEKNHAARLYQYNLNTGALKEVLECDQVTASAKGYGKPFNQKAWEITGMIDISETTGVAKTFLLITQNHGWEPADGSAFTDPKANPAADSRKEGSMLYVIQGLDR